MHCQGLSRRPSERRIYPLVVGEFDQINLWLDIRPLEVLERCNLNLIVEMADVADDAHVLELAHMVDRYDVLVARARDDDVGIGCRLIQGHDLETVHAGLQRTDGVDFGDLHPGARAAQTGS